MDVVLIKRALAAARADLAGAVSKLRKEDARGAEVRCERACDLAGAARELLRGGLGAAAEARLEARLRARLGGLS